MRAAIGLLNFKNIFCSFFYNGRLDILKAMTHLRDTKVEMILSGKTIILIVQTTPIASHRLHCDPQTKKHFEATSRPDHLSFNCDSSVKLTKVTMVSLVFQHFSFRPILRVLTCTIKTTPGHRFSCMRSFRLYFGPCGDVDESLKLKINAHCN